MAVNEGFIELTTTDIVGGVEQKRNERRKMKDLQKKLSHKFDYFKKFVMAKNRKYGDSAVTPVRIFSKADRKEGILVRLDDKMSRLVKGNLPLDQELIRDIIGYLALYSIVLDEENGKEYQKEKAD